MEAMRATEAAFKAQIAQIQTIPLAGSYDQARAITAAFQGLITRVLSSDTHDVSEIEQKQARKVAARKAGAIRDLAQESKAFSSLSEVLAAVHHKLNHLGSDEC